MAFVKLYDGRFVVGGLWFCCLLLLSACTSFNASVFEDFSETTLDSTRWQPRVTGSLSKVNVRNGVLVVTAVNDPNGETGRAGLNFANPNFEAFQADVKVVEFSGDEKTRVRLEGHIYNTGLRQMDSDKGEVAVYFYLRPTGKVQYLIETCQDHGCESRMTIANETVATVDPGEQHTLAMGFDGENVLFRLNSNKPISVAITNEYPVETSGWGYASVRARSKEGIESITAEIDNVKVGTITELFAP